MKDPAPADCFAPSYTAARVLFLHACATAGGALESHRHPLSGPAGEPLFLDEARFGPPDARRVVFIASGTHGVEGFCGSAIQTFLLRDGLAGRLPADVALVLVHAVNPWGFAWSRRVNEDNVDVNRNFVDHTTAYPANPDYDRLDAVINPARLDADTIAAGTAALTQFREERGLDAMYGALAGGQYGHPHGTQYGGRAPVWSNRTLRNIWARHAAGSDVAVYIDLHSGLGASGVGDILQTAPDASIETRVAKAWWPEVIRSAPDRSVNPALLTGLTGPAFTAALAPVPAVAITLEFGTVDLSEVMFAVQADNWLQHHGTRDSEAGRRITERMRAAFLVDADDWKTDVCQRARDVVDRGLAGVATYAADPPGEGAPHVRPAHAADAEVLVAFAQAMARETENLELDLPTARAGVGTLLDDPARGRVFVVDVAGEVVATLMLTDEWSDWRNGLFWWIQSVYVSPPHRRRGHYRRLHEHVQALATRDPDVYGIRLYVEHENHSAQSTYRALGMRETPYRLYEQKTRGSAQ